MTGKKNYEGPDRRSWNAKPEFWLKVIAAMGSLMAAASAIAVTILFSIYNMTSHINDKAFVLNAGVQTNLQQNIEQDKRLDRHENRFDDIDVKLSEHEKSDLRVWGNAVK